MAAAVPSEEPEEQENEIHLHYSSREHLLLCFRVQLCVLRDAQIRSGIRKRTGTSANVRGAGHEQT